MTALIISVSVLLIMYFYFKQINSIRRTSLLWDCQHSYKYFTFKFFLFANPKFTEKLECPEHDAGTTSTPYDNGRRSSQSVHQILKHSLVLYKWYSGNKLSENYKLRKLQPPCIHTETENEDSLR